MKQTLRPYQEKAIKKIEKSLENGKKPIFQIATGGGKTTVAAEFLRRHLKDTRALVIAHTQEIIFQIYNRIKGQFDDNIDIGIVMGANDNASSQVVVATRQTLSKVRLDKVLQHGAIEYCIIDESHHALDKNTYGRIIKQLCEHNPNCKIFGMTATPFRSDGEALASIFDEICFKWDITDGIDSGYLVPPTHINVRTKVDASQVKTAQGDYKQDQLISVLNVANWDDICIEAFEKYCLKKKTLIYLPSIDMSRSLTKKLQDKGHAVAHVDGSTPDDIRSDTLSKLKSGQLIAVSNVLVFTEGLDLPEIDAILLGRPTRSKNLYTQVIGRGLRPVENKKDCIVVNLAVNDIKAVNQRSLGGKTIQCWQCNVDYYTSFEVCPFCGAEKYKPVLGIRPFGSVHKEKEIVTGVGLFEVEDSFLSKLFGAWYSDNDYITCSFAFEKGGAILIRLSDNGAEAYELNKSSKVPPVLIDSGLDIKALIKRLDRLIRKSGWTANALSNWRFKPPSESASKFLVSLGGTVLPEFTMGDVSQIITHLLSIKHFEAHRNNDIKKNSVL